MERLTLQEFEALLAVRPAMEEARVALREAQVRLERIQQALDAAVTEALRVFEERTEDYLKILRVQSILQKLQAYMKITKSA